MKLIHISTGKDVEIGDVVSLLGESLTIEKIHKPDRPASEGRVCVSGAGGYVEYYVSVVGLQWI